MSGGRTAAGPTGTAGAQGSRGPAHGLSPSPARAHRDLELASAGWERRFVGSPPRLLEFVDLYARLGREVFLDPLTPEELREECAECTLALSLFRVIYTRPRSAPPERNEP